MARAPCARPISEHLEDFEIDDALSVLTPREYEALRLFAHGHNGAEIGEAFGLTRQAANQLQKRAIRQVREAIA